MKIKENEKRDKYLDLARERKTLWNMKMTVIPTVISMLGMIAKGLVKAAGGVRNRRTNRDHPNYSIAKVCKNTEKSPRDLRRLAVI